jgi:HSP20 family molecular chaperone IbpA
MQGSLVRRLELPQQVQADQINAAFENGLLTITVPKAAKPEAVKIPIGSAQKQLAGKQG